MFKILNIFFLASFFQKKIKGGVHKMLKIKMRNYIAALLTAAGMTTSFMLQAGSWDGGDWPKYKQGRVIEYLIITGNYESPRLLAEIIQKESRNPILLLPASGQKSEIFLMLPDGKVPAKVDPDQLSAYISGLNPKRIIIIGDSSIVPPEYRLTINQKYEITAFGSKSWSLNAMAADNLFNSNKIQKTFLQKTAAAKSAGKTDAKANDNTKKPEPKAKSEKKAESNADKEDQANSMLDPLPENKTK